MIENFKKAILLVAGSAVQKLGKKIASEQEILMNISDMLITAYLAESSLLRVSKMSLNASISNMAISSAIVKVYFYDAADQISKSAKDALHSFVEGDELKMSLMGIKRFTKSESLNCKELRRSIADHVISKGMYSVS